MYEFFANILVDQVGILLDIQSACDIGSLWRDISANDEALIQLVTQSNSSL